MKGNDLDRIYSKKNKRMNMNAKINIVINLKNNTIKIDDDIKNEFYNF